MCSSSATADLTQNNRRPHETSSVLLPICIATMTVIFSNVVIVFWTDAVLSIFKLNQQDATLHNDFITTIVLHISGGSSAHHQKLKTLYTTSGSRRGFLLLTAIVSESQLTHDSD